MANLSDKAIDTARKLSPHTQDEIAHAMLALAGDDGAAEDVDPAHLADVLESLAQARRRAFASDADIETAFRQFEA